MGELLPDAAVTAIQDSVRVETITGPDGHVYYTQGLCLPPPEPTTAPVVMLTLSGLVDFIDSSKDAAHFELVHIAGPTHVTLLGPINGRHRSREVFAQAKYSNPKPFPFNEWISVESFLIGLQANFADAPVRSQVLSIIGNLTDESVRSLADNGISQTVAVRQGISLVEPRALPNPVALRLFRTFAEIEQPESLFVLRVKSNDKGLPVVGLWEAADGRWQLDVIAKIKDYLENNLQADLPILA